MKAILIFLFLICLLSCSTGQKLIERKLDDGGTVTVKKEKFSGVDYLYVEKNIGKRKLYKLYYGCECGFDNKILLKKNTFNDNGEIIIWEAVTDTVGQIKFFDKSITSSRLFLPLTFFSITAEEVSVLEEGLNQINLSCCRNPNKPISQIIGFVKAKTE